jgi:hypothetical protein
MVGITVLTPIAGLAPNSPSPATVLLPKPQPTALWANPPANQAASTLPADYFATLPPPSTEGLTPRTAAPSCWRRLASKVHQHCLQHSFYLKQVLAPQPSVGMLAQSNEPALPLYLVGASPSAGWLLDATGQVQGHLTSQGAMRLKGHTGDWSVFNNPFFQPSYISLKSVGPLGRNVLATAFERSMQNNLAPYLRSQYPQLSGAGQRVDVIDFDPDHVNNLASVLLSPQYGIAPGAVLVPHMVAKQASLTTTQARPLPQSMAQFNQQLTSEFISDLHTLLQPLQALATAPDPPPTVLMLSLTMERNLDPLVLEEQLLKPALRQAQALQASQRQGDITPAEAAARRTWLEQCQALLAGSPAERHQRLQQVVLDALAHSPELAEALASYQQAAHALTEQGCLMLVAAGNANNQHLAANATKQAALFNLLTASADVMAIGGSDMMQTPATVWDDKVAAFSNPVVASEPNLQRQHPDLMAPAVLLPIDGRILGHPTEQAFNSGTSLAVPLVAGLVCLMKEANPRLSHRELKAMLLASCANPSHLNPSIVGAGLLDPLMPVGLAVGSTTTALPL